MFYDLVYLNALMAVYVAHAGTISDPIGSTLPLSLASSAAPTLANARTPTASSPVPPAIDGPPVGTVDTTADAQADPNIGGYT